MDFRTKFTKWYYKKGYKIDFEVVGFADGVGQMVYLCPWWIKPLTAYFFSPTVYFNEEMVDTRMRSDKPFKEVSNEHWDGV